MKETIIGSWLARRDGRINANSFAECSDILTLERDGKVFRQFDTTKVVVRQDGGKERYQVIVTLVGDYELNDDVLVFKNLTPRYETSKFMFDDSDCSPEVKSQLERSEIERNGISVLEYTVGEVIVNKGLECMQSTSNQIPACHVRVENDSLKMKWDGYDVEDVMVKCDEPANLDRVTPGLPLDVAVKMQEFKLFEAITEGNCLYLKNVILYMPCNVEQKNGEYSIKFQPLETQGMKLIIAFSDMNTMNQSELASNYSQRKFTNLRELASLMTAFDGVCLNPVNGKSFCLRKEMVTAILENRWGGIGDDGKPVMND
ncbi:MAG: SseB family protein [Paludibacteraceae bacterium]|nr:SseB family protein [Paludibacteraceae bacterium]